MSRTTWPKLISRGCLARKVSARLAALRIDVTGDFELGEDLLEEFHRESLLFDELANLEQTDDRVRARCRNR